MGNTPYADKVITRLCAVCFKQRPAGVCHLQYGGVGHWYACEECCEAYHRERQPGPDAQIGNLGKAREPGLFEDE